MGTLGGVRASGRARAQTLWEAIHMEAIQIGESNRAAIKNTLGLVEKATLKSPIALRSRQAHRLRLELAAHETTMHLAAHLVASSREHHFVLARHRDPRLNQYPSGLFSTSCSSGPS